MKPNDRKKPRKPAAKPVKPVKPPTASSSTKRKPKAGAVSRAVAKRKPKAAAPKKKRVLRSGNPLSSAPSAILSTEPAAKEEVVSAHTKPLQIPPILLEGDVPATPPASGPGRRYALDRTHAAASTGAELPEAYGTRQLFLAARDPLWLYAHWDFNRQQLQSCNALSADGHLMLRIYRDALGGEPLSQIHLHPESRSWFVPVPAAGAKYLAQLGYRDDAGTWVPLALSGATFTPPDTLSEDTSVRFATIPPDVSFGKLLATVEGAVREHTPLVEAMQQMRAQGFQNLPAPDAIHHQWSPAQEKALADVISIDNARRVWIGSLEITELIRRELQGHLPSPGGVGVPGELPAGALPAMPLPEASSPAGGAEARLGFWFNVNAEMIIYGATEPDAIVSIGGRPITLRPDGSFSFRYALPDGQYAMEAVAFSADGSESRRANLQFTRLTEYQGHVGAHPQDQDLAPPPGISMA